MARHAENQLNTRTLPGGSLELFGRVNGQRIRERFRDVEALDARRLELEHTLQTAPDRSQHLRLTWLTEAQLRDAEAAVRRAGGRALLECVEASDRVMTTSEPVLLVNARAEWETDARKRRREIRTIDGNDDRMAAFIRWLPAGIDTVQAVTPDHAEAYILRQTYARGQRVADHTRVAHARVLRAWGRFWVRRRWCVVSPFETLNVADLEQSAEPAQLPRILTPAQARALMHAALERDSDPLRNLSAYVALSTWCFLRHSEVLRLRADDIRLDAVRPVVEIRPKKRGTPSYRTVEIPACVVPILRAALAGLDTPERRAAWRVAWGRVRWDHLRAAAGLVTLSPVRQKKRNIVAGLWQENILRHTGLSYLYQRTGDIREVTRQAGNSSDVAFRHYLQLSAPGAADAFYSPLTSTTLSPASKKTASRSA
jgi:integrase